MKSPVETTTTEAITTEAITKEAITIEAITIEATSNHAVEWTIEENSMTAPDRTRKPICWMITRW